MVFLKNPTFCRKSVLKFQGFFFLEAGGVGGGGWGEGGEAELSPCPVFPIFFIQTGMIRTTTGPKIDSPLSNTPQWQLSSVMMIYPTLKAK